jgi:hypothetical protein
VHEQLNDIPITSCAPALPVRTACTTVLTSTETNVSCDSQDVCVTVVETIVETNTHTPFWPTLNGSLTDVKRSAAMLTTETVETTTVLATAQSLVVPSSIADDEDSTLTPETATPSSTGEASASGSAEEPSESEDETTPSPTPDINPVSSGSTSTGLGGFIISGLGSGTSSVSSSEDLTSQSSRVQPGSTSRATTSTQEQPSAPSATSAACDKPDPSAYHWGIWLFGVVVLMAFEMV